MKHITLTLSVAAAALFTIPSLTLAEDKPAGEPGKRPGGPGGPGRPGAFTPEERLKRMTEHLGLNEDQQAKIKAIFDKGADQTKALREKGRDNLTDDDKAKMREFFKQQQEDIAAVLTPEQKEKMKEMRPKGGPGEGKPGEGRPGGERKPGGGGPKPEAK